MCWRWTASLNSILSFLDLRQGTGAQDEITEYANAVATFIEGQYPTVMEAWNDARAYDIFEDESEDVYCEIKPCKSSGKAVVLCLSWVYNKVRGKEQSQV